MLEAESRARKPASGWFTTAPGAGPHAPFDVPFYVNMCVGGPLLCGCCGDSRVCAGCSTGVSGLYAADTTHTAGTGPSLLPPSRIFLPPLPAPSHP